ncbi:hypothetical protein [Nesterenkonia haasae]|uniref:hypothetical protein n=1 Tax=Nesterenkonia haasae TaxID=2587813 RepID=UPI001390A612|nr:hypothetical protein [Nesterenkonia haasae]NDK31213.1 hypothetical protein [Nesterenkonia haasae]
MSEPTSPDASARPDDETTPDAPTEEQPVSPPSTAEEQSEAQTTSEASEAENPAVGDPSREPNGEDTRGDTAENGPEEGLPTEDASAEETPAGNNRAEPPVRTGVAPKVAVSSGPDTGLGGFFDTLDERAKSWWSTRKLRHARRRVEAAKTAKAPAEPESTQGKPPTDAAPPAGTVARRARRSGGHLPETTTHTDAAAAAPQVSLPKPPPADQRPEHQLFTDAIPVVSPDMNGEAHDPAHRAPGDASTEETTVLPAYRDAPDTPPAPPARRELDEQRQRTVIAQKAAAIEKATGEFSPRPYGGSGYIGDQYREQSAEFADDEEDLFTYIPPYSLPSRSPDPEPTQWDLARRVFVSLGALAAVISTLWMFGWFSSGEEDPAILGQRGLYEAHSEGWFSGEHALLSPDYNWYWLWPLITVGLIIHACYQWRASQHSTPRQQHSGWFVGTASILMLVVTASLYTGIFTLTLLSSAIIAGVLTEAIRQFNLYTARSDTERKLTDDILGLFYGFALVQVMSALSVWLTHQGWHIPGIPALLWAGIGLLVCVWTAAFYSMTERGRITIALGLAWGLFWLIFPRILGEVTSVWIAIGAAMGAFIVILCTQSRRYRINHAERRAAMGRPLEDII